MQTKSVFIPERLRKFPLYQGRYVIHFTLPVGKDGVPAFRSLNRVKQVLCANQGRCHLCGERLHPPYYFICGDREIAEKVASSNGPMHEECARYAIEACPFLSNPHYQGKEEVEIGRSAVVLAELKKRGVEGRNVRPSHIALCTTDRYTCDTTKQILDFEVPYWLTVDWDAIPSREEKKNDTSYTARKTEVL